MRKIATELSALIEKNKKLRKKYEGQGVDLDRDAGRSAKPFGYRFKGKKDYRVPTEAQIKRGLKRGTIDYEARPNRSDVYPKGYKGKIKLEEGGMMAKGGMTKEKAEKRLEELRKELRAERISYAELAELQSLKKYIDKSDVELLEAAGVDEFKKGGDVQGKQTDKAKDGQRFAKPRGWRWKDEALKVVGKVKMGKSPSKFMRDKYPDLVYWEDRIDKSDKNPSRKYISN